MSKKPAKGGALKALQRAVFPGVLLFAGYCSVYGGEYSWMELREARAAVEQEASELVEMRQEIDSLAAWADSLKTDSATLERVARENFGMIRDGETLFRFEPSDSAPPADSSAAGNR